MYTENEIYTLLDAKGITYKKLKHNPVFTIEDMEREKLLDEGGVCKNLFLRDAKGKTHYLLVVPEDKRVNLKEVERELDTTRLSFASEKRLKKFLDLSPGAVTPFGILNDENAEVILAFDEEISPDDIIGIHPNTNRATIWLSLKDLEDIIGEHGNIIKHIKISRS